MNFIDGTPRLSTPATQVASGVNLSVVEERIQTAVQNYADVSSTVIDGKIQEVRDSAVLYTAESIQNYADRQSVVDYENLYPRAMKASITASGGGTNQAFGNIATYIAGANLLAGRVVSLKDELDDNTQLSVQYLKNGTETDPAIVPIGVTQNNALLGESVNVCILGFTTVICENADSSPERGSQVINGTQNQGKIRINNAGGGNESRLGFVAQSDGISSESPILIYYDGWFQPF